MHAAAAATGRSGGSWLHLKETFGEFVTRLPPAGYFSCVRQEKYPKEADSGEALEREIYLTAYHVIPCYPDFKPPSPENPSRPLRVS